MPEHPEFLAAIYEHPEDDAPRLVYADWLEEHGDSKRAELIRLQCQAARGALEYEDWADELVDENRAAWTAHLPQAETVEWEFHRGFPEQLAIPLPLLLDRWAFWAAVPYVRRLTLVDTTAYSLQTFATLPWNEAWTALRFEETPKPWLHAWPYDASSGVRAVVMSPQAQRLRELRFVLHASTLGDDGIAALCESPHLSGLTVLGLDAAYAADARLVERFGERLRGTHAWD